MDHRRWAKPLIPRCMAVWGKHQSSVQTYDTIREKTRREDESKIAVVPILIELIVSIRQHWRHFKRESTIIANCIDSSMPHIPSVIPNSVVFIGWWHCIERNNTWSVSWRLLVFLHLNGCVCPWILKIALKLYYRHRHRCWSSVALAKSTFRLIKTGHHITWNPLSGRI